ncbi:MAG: hypothetical protein VX910_05210 [Candidatus Latescibacterota bacterium]|nr:hypothetical protein [Candidatus Latescibacterota bacterium]
MAIANWEKGDHADTLRSKLLLVGSHRLGSTSDSSRCRAKGWNRLYGSGEAGYCRQGERVARTLTVCIRKMVRMRRSHLKMYSKRNVVNKPMIRHGGSDFFADRRLIQSVSIKPFAERYNSDTSK